MTIRQDSQSVMGWTQFCDSRTEFLTLLAETVELGFTRRDTDHPAFCGCIDWHSSVHGAYALLTAARLTGRSHWSEVVDSALVPSCLEAELLSLKNGELDHELPYGYAWFLKLAIEREQGHSKADLMQLATELASRLEHWIFDLRAGEVIQSFQQREYRNMSWALLNLWEWSRWTVNHILMETILAFTRKWVVLLDKQLPQSYDHVTDEFFAASLQRTRVILSVLPPDEAQSWLASFYQDDYSLKPLEQAETPHSAGLNFSRAWAYWTLYSCTGIEQYRARYVDHIVTHMKLQDCWQNDYRKHAHWVPQFGVYAIALSMDGEGTKAEAIVP